MEAADRLIRNIPEAARELLKKDTSESIANQRVQQLAAEKGLWIAPHWTGRRVCRGAGIAVVGNPQQCAYAAALYRCWLPFLLPLAICTTKRPSASAGRFCHYCRTNPEWWQFS